MLQRTPPPCGNDPLSSFLAAAEHNERATAANFPAVFGLLQRTHAVFEKVEAALANQQEDPRGISVFFFSATHSAFVAAIRLAMSGQFRECCAVLRTSIEHSWYALHIANDPKTPRRAEVWAKGGEGAEVKQAIKKEFTIRKVRATHEKLDAQSAIEMQRLYDLLIDYGGHPNLNAIITSVQASQRGDGWDYRMGKLHPTKGQVMVSLKWTVTVSIGVFKLFRLIFPERFEIMDLEADIRSLILDVNRVFKRADVRTGA